MRTVNLQNVCDEFIHDIEEIDAYITKCRQVFSEDKKYLSNSYEYAAIALYKAFEHFILRVLISCLNHDHTHIENLYGVRLGKHINDDVCEFLVTKGGFFDFRGKSGLIKAMSDLIGKNHKIVNVFKKGVYHTPIEQLVTIRNYAAHNSKLSKKRAREAFRLTNIGTAGSCLKAMGRLEAIMTSLSALANDIKTTGL